MLLTVTLVSTAGSEPSAADEVATPLDGSAASTTLSASTTDHGLAKTTNTTKPGAATTSMITAISTDIGGTVATPPTSDHTSTEHTSTEQRLTDKYSLLVDADDPAIVARPVPDEPDPDDSPPVTITPPPWAASTRSSPAGYTLTDLGCADGLSAGELDRFFAERVGPVLGWDYPHVYRLTGDRYLWTFQDTFLDHSGTKTTLNSARFVHNTAMLQQGRCFTLLHRGSADRPEAFEPGDGGGGIRTRWFWPMGGDSNGSVLSVVWAEMVKDPYDPAPPDGLGWHPQQVYVARYDVLTLERLSFDLMPNSGVAPIYGYAIESDETHTYLFGNTFEQNLVREGGFWNGPHSATQMFLARVPLHRLDLQPEYWSEDGWSPTSAAATPIMERFFAENPMQPRYLDGQWASATAVDGYWGNDFAIDLADHPWGPWQTTTYAPLIPRNADPKMNTYHAHVLPWRDGFGSLVIAVSNNARNMVRDAYPFPHRYRPVVYSVPYEPTPRPPSTAPNTVAPPVTGAPSTAPPTTLPVPTTTTSTSSTTTSSTTTSSSTTTTSTSTPTTTSTSTTTSTTSTSTTTSISASTTTSTSVPRSTSTTVPDSSTSTVPTTTVATPPSTNA